MADACETPTTRHPLFYYEHGMTIFQVEFTLYKLYHPILVEESQVFAALFGYGSDAIPNEGKTNKSPIFLPNLTTEVFDVCPVQIWPVSVQETHPMTQLTCF